MKQALLMVLILVIFPPLPQGAEVSRTLAQDAAILSSAKGKKWKSDVLSMQSANGTPLKQSLLMEFVRVEAVDATNAPDAKVTLGIESPLSGVEGVASVSTSLSMSGLREARLHEKDRVRTITIRQGADSIGGSPSPASLERILNRSAISFVYELSGDTLTLKGFPQGITKWGSLEFTIPEPNVTFRAVR